MVVLFGDLFSRNFPSLASLARVPTFFDTGFQKKVIEFLLPEKILLRFWGFEASFWLPGQGISPPGSNSCLTGAADP